MSAKPRFTHVGNFTGYMKRVVEHVHDALGDSDSARVLDVPAGNGLIVDAMKSLGYDATGGDINDERDDYVKVNMEEAFPFPDGSFDAVTCLEGIEHVMDPAGLVREIARVTRPGGLIIISTPNTMNLYSRIVFLLQGQPYQFLPSGRVHPTPGRPEDRGHIWPVSYPILRYLLQEAGCTIDGVDGDKIKRKLLMPLYIPIILLNWIMARGGAYRTRSRNQPELDSIRAHVLSKPLLFSRSLIVIARKNDSGGSHVEAES
ncbi:MAG: hypothetical protein CMJ32_06850 [Phycisphaerae bacterium]|nr:hypothetical protein [Phycisphaerae bacterium]